MKIVQLAILASISLVACTNKYSGIPESYHNPLDASLQRAGENSEQILMALENTPEEQKEGMAFLISYMPERDLKALTSDFLLENVVYAYKAREEYPWCKNLPDSIFFNEVLPYSNITEDRDQWRKNFYERFSGYVKDCNTIAEAIYEVSQNIKDEVGVEYNVKRSRVDISPFQAMKEQMATCTGLSILLTDAFRSVGIPSRLAGTAMWTNMKGNHTWSEVWIDGEWMFTEYYPDTLNKSWFVADAGKADPSNPIHWIYAVSYKPTEIYFPAGEQIFLMLNDLDKSQIPKSWLKGYEKMKEKGNIDIEKYIYGENVTQRYIDLCKNSIEAAPLSDDETIANFVIYKDKDSQTSDMRLSCRVDVYSGEEKIDFGYSPSRIDDNNNFLKFKLKKNTSYNIELKNNEFPDQIKTLSVKTNGDNNQEFSLALF